MFLCCPWKYGLCHLKNKRILKPWQQSLVQCSGAQYQTSSLIPWRSETCEVPARDRCTHSREGAATLHQFNGEEYFFRASAALHAFKCVFCHVRENQYLNLTALQLENSRMFTFVHTTKLTAKKPYHLIEFALQLLIATLYQKRCSHFDATLMHTALFPPHKSEKGTRGQTPNHVHKNTRRVPAEATKASSHGLTSYECVKLIVKVSHPTQEATGTLRVNREELAPVASLSGCTDWRCSSVRWWYSTQYELRVWCDKTYKSQCLKHFSVLIKTVNCYCFYQNQRANQPNLITNLIPKLILNSHNLHLL